MASRWIQRSTTPSSHSSTSKKIQRIYMGPRDHSPCLKERETTATSVRNNHGLFSLWAYGPKPVLHFRHFHHSLFLYSVHLMCTSAQKMAKMRHFTYMSNKASMLVCPAFCQFPVQVSGGPPSGEFRLTAWHRSRFQIVPVVL